jgi:hypothetical protein
MDLIEHWDRIDLLYYIDVLVRALDREADVKNLPNNSTYYPIGS